MATYSTSQGQTLQDISAKTGYSTSDLMSANKGLTTSGAYGAGVNINLPSTSSVSASTPIPSAPTQPVSNIVSPAVHTSKPAQQDYQIIKTGYDNALQGIKSQQQLLTQQQQQTQADAAAKAAQQAQDQLTAQKQKELDIKQAAIYGTPQTLDQQWAGKTVYNPTTGKMDVINAIGKSGDNYLVSFASDPNQKFINQQDFAKLTLSPEEGQKDYAQIQLDKINQEYNAKSNEVTNTIQNIQNGIIPLSAGQQAQIDALKQQYQQMINQQNLINTSASGVANIRGYQTGAAEYDPMFQIKTIGSIVNAGQQKITQLNTEMAAAVANMTEGFRQNNIDQIKSAWDIYSKTAENRQKYLQEVVQNTQKAIQNAQDAQVKQQELYYTQVTKPINDISATLAKIPGVPGEVIAKVAQSQTVGEAIKNAGPYLQTATGDLGNYLYIARQAEARGMTPIPYEDWLANKKQAEINLAFQKAMATAKGAAEGKKAAGGAVVTKTGVPAPVSGYQTEKAQQTISLIDKAYNQVNESTAGGITATISGMIPGTAAKDLQKTITAIKANIGFSELQTMRENSKTGGALGPVSDKENELLQSTLGSLDTAQSPEQLKNTLMDIKKHYQNVLGIIDIVQGGGDGVQVILDANKIPIQTWLQIKQENPQLTDQEILNDMRTQGYIK